MGIISPKLFLSHSSKDKEFVRRLALDLTAMEIEVWLDAWEIKVGDSLMQKIESGISSAAYFGIVLSQASTNSKGWVKKELAAGLALELERQNVFILPILIEDCDIPVLFKDKKYADFRTSYEDGLNELEKSIQSPDLKDTGTATEGEYKTDWAVDFGSFGDSFVLDIIILDYSTLFPYSTFSKIRIATNEVTSQRIIQHIENGFQWNINYLLMSQALTVSETSDCKILIPDDEEAEQTIKIFDPSTNASLIMSVSARRLGPDPGTDILFNWGKVLKQIAEQQRKAIEKVISAEERQNYIAWITANPVKKLPN